MNELPEIIDSIYTAAVDERGWATTVGALQTYFRCSSAGIYNADLRRGDATLVHLRDIDPAYVRAYIDHYLKDNPWSAVPALQVPGRIRTDRSLDEHYNQPGYYRRTSYFNDWMRPQDFFYSMGTNLAETSALRTKLFLYRPRSEGPFTSADVSTLARLVKHLINAVNVARRIARREVRSLQAFDLLERLRFGVVFLDALGCVIEANAFARALFRDRNGLTHEEGRLAALGRDDSARLTRLIRCGLAAAVGDPAEAPGMVHLRRPGARSLQAMIVPLPRVAQDPFSERRAAAALIVSDPEQEPALSTEDISARHGLTPKEARLAQSLSRGMALREAARAAGVSYETARGYLKSIFQKTGTTKQSALVRLLLSERMAVGVPVEG